MLETLTWKEARKLVSTVNPELSKIIDSIDPNEQYKIYRAKYRYGDQIVKDGNFYLPSQDDPASLIPFTDASSELKEQLGYNFGSNPATLLLNNSLELFIQLSGRVIPYSIIRPGNFFGLWNVLENQTSHYSEASFWNLTAGSRSIFLLPKVSISNLHANLRTRYGLTVEPPKCLLDQWEIFCQLANHPDFKSPWEADVLFFGKNWFEHQSDESWLPFNYHLYRTAWQNNSYWRNKNIMDLILSQIQENRNIKPSNYTMVMAKYVLATSMGALPGFAPALDDKQAPIKEIQDIYINDYGLQQYLPIIMQPTYFDMLSGDSPVYISLQHNTAMETAKQSNKRNTAITNLYDVNLLLTKYFEDIASDGVRNSTSNLYNVTKRVQFDFFHSHTAGYTSFKDSSLLPVEDNNFSEAYLTSDSNAKLPRTAHFFNGCIRIKKKESL